VEGAVVWVSGDDAGEAGVGGDVPVADDFGFGKGWF